MTASDTTSTGAGPPEEARFLGTQAGYDEWSALYDTDGNPLVALEDRVAPGLLGDVAGRRIADVGCGTGRHALRLAAVGAEVTALDFSSGMLGAARAKPGAERVRWIEHDLTRPLPLPDAAFDLALCALVFDHVTDVDGLMRELARIARPSPDGAVVMTVMHPAMMLRGVQARFTDPSTGRKTMLASATNQVSHYVMGALRAGLTITHLHEHVVDDELIRSCPRAEKHRGWPLLLVMRAERAQ